MKSRSQNTEVSSQKKEVTKQRIEIDVTIDGDDVTYDVLFIPHKNLKPFIMMDVMDGIKGELILETAKAMDITPKEVIILRENK